MTRRLLDMLHILDMLHRCIPRYTLKYTLAGFLSEQTVVPCYAFKVFTNASLVGVMTVDTILATRAARSSTDEDSPGSRT